MKSITLKLASVLALTIAMLSAQIALATNVTVPAGTGFLVRTTQTLSTDNVSSGHRFTARLEADLVADGIVVAPRGSTVYGVVTQAKRSGRMVGSSTLSFTLTDIMINKPFIIY